MLESKYYEQITAGLEKARDTNEISNWLSQFTNKINMRYFGYWAINVPGREARDPLILTNYPAAWFKEYGEKKYAIIDPVIRNAPMHIHPFEWGTKEYLEALSEQERAVFTAAKKHGIKLGIVAPVHCSGNEFSGFSVVAHEAETEDEFKTYYIARSRAVGELAPYIHSAIRRVLKVEDQVQLARSLTPREFECLSWIAKGKSFADVADILTISRTTVITHVNRSKEKLGVRTTQQAVAQLIGSGLVFSEYQASSI